VALCFLLSAVAGIAQEEGGPARMKQIKETIAKVRSDRTARARTEAAEHLARLAKKSAAKKSRRRS
jgi:hypothetical protein